MEIHAAVLEKNAKTKPLTKYNYYFEDAALIACILHIIYKFLCIKQWLYEWELI